MASIPRDTDINPLSQLYDELKTILSGLVVKFSVKADAYETLETRKYSDTYIAAINKTDSFGLYEYTKDDCKGNDDWDCECDSGSERWYNCGCYGNLWAIDSFD